MKKGENNANWKGGKKQCKCFVCGDKFETYINGNHKGKYCSKECRGKGYIGKNNPCYKNAKVIKKCNWCNNDFESYKYRNAKFCSMRCTTMYTLKYCVKQEGTDIEQIIEKWLIENRIKYNKQKPIGNFTIVDFFIYPDVCLYADGDYWHSKPERIKKDTEIDMKLRKLGYFPQRIRGSNIKKNLEFFNSTMQSC